MPRKKKKAPQDPLASAILARHFKPIPLTSLVSTARTFPSPARVDLQKALEKVIGSRFQAPALVGFSRQYSGSETATFSTLVSRSSNGWPALVAPLQYDDIDIGEVQPFRCLKMGIWLCAAGETPFALVLAPNVQYGQKSGVHIEIAVPPGEEGLNLSRAMFHELEREVSQAGSYRGKVLSLELLNHYYGQPGDIKVHKLHSVGRDEVILPEKTLALLDRNVDRFVAEREKLKALGLPIKKGLLFYGPPGTGKTHTIHYLASQLPGHTTLLITSEQVALLDQYMQLARFLQPAIVVIEDADLIARDRAQMQNVCSESLLNKLLNEMDGLREDAAILFILTTNRPSDIEAALSSRPGRVDQAIEFPLPDDGGRRKLAKLYSRSLPVSEDVVEQIVERTERASAAFIKELMRRAAQYHLQEGQDGALKMRSVELALEEMLLSGGSLNAKLLGIAPAS